MLCIWCNRICWHALIFKKHITFQILYIIVGPLCPTSLKRFVFYKVPPSNKRSLLWLANWPRALWLAEHHKPRRKCNVPLHNRELQLSKLKTVNNVLSFTISSSPKEEQSRVTDSDDARMCLQTSCGCVTMSPSLTHASTHAGTHAGTHARTHARTRTHTHTHTHTRLCAVTLSLSLSLSHTHTHTTRKTPHLNSQ